MIESNHTQRREAESNARFRSSVSASCCTEPSDSVGLFWTLLTIAVLFGSPNALFGNEDSVVLNNPFDDRIPSTDAWRTPERSSVNALYMFLSICDVDCSYNEVLMRLSKGESGRSLLGIRDASRTYGLSASVYKCKPEALSSLQVPVIAHLQGSRTDGEFSLVLPVRNTSQVFIVDVQTCELKAISRDFFLREWNGYILRPEKESLRPYLLLAAGAFLLYVAMRIFGHSVLRRVKTIQGSLLNPNAGSLSGWSRGSVDALAKVIKERVIRTE